jgi:hypothetical protein
MSISLSLMLEDSDETTIPEKNGSGTQWKAFLIDKAPT